MRSGVVAKAVAVLVLAIGLAVSAWMLPGCGATTGPQMPDKTDQEIITKIDNIIYPTLGYPQMVPPGQGFTLEFDFTEDNPRGAQPKSVEDWQVAITSSNGPSPYRADLEVTGAELGTSRRWPQGSGRNVYQVYLVSAVVPRDVPADLYDLEVTVKADGKDVADSQPNSISVADVKQDYRVLQVTDIHVFDIQYPGSCTHDRSLHDAVYLRKAIEQINLVHPDFVIFTGDLIFGQKYMPANWPPDDDRTGSSEYEYEYLWAYNAMSGLDVPCFMLMGNHDGYNDTIKDGYEWWTETFGPIYYSFDYGNDHYTMIDTMDWSQADRTLEKGSFYEFAQILQPHKWQGQLRSGGDGFGEAQAPPPETYADQLGWIRDDLKSNGEAGLGIACCHHDPAEPDSWDDEDYAGYRIGGKGEGRLALQGLCADYQVDMLLSGHEHHDLITELPWSAGGGATIYANTTCLQPNCGQTVDYSGYRMVEIEGDRIVSYNYQEPKWSYPYYKGIMPGQENDLDPLYDPAISLAFSNGGDWSSRQSEVSCTVSNSLDSEFKPARLEFHMPAPPDGSNYAVTGADAYSLVAVPGQEDWVNVYVDFTLPALSTTQVVVRPG